MNLSSLIQKFGKHCSDHCRCDVSACDCVVELTDMLFRKMAHERDRPFHNQPCPVPDPYACFNLKRKDGDEMFDHNRHTVEA